jgi:HPt (histidine-containing phosphotransfer) domain-containing protein
MLRILEKNMREYPVLMHKELESGNLKALRETAHKFKSSTAYTGLTKFNATLNRIELCEEQTLTLDEVRALVDEIALASVQIREQVEELILQQDL